MVLSLVLSKVGGTVATAFVPVNAVKEALITIAVLFARFENLFFLSIFLSFYMLNIPVKFSGAKLIEFPITVLRLAQWGT